MNNNQKIDEISNSEHLVNPDNDLKSHDVKTQFGKINFAYVFVGLLIIVLIIASGYKIIAGTKQIADTSTSTPVITDNDIPSSEESAVFITQISDPPTATSTPIPSPTPQLFTLNLSTSNYSTGQRSGDVIGARIKLYNTSGTLLGEKIIPPQEPGSNKFPVVTYYVPLGTYRFEAETDHLISSGEITISSFNDQAYQTINMVAKPMTVSGTFFVDNNQNNQVDPGEERLSNQEIKAFHMGEASFEIWEAGSTVTDANGNFSIPIKNYSGLYQLQGPLYLPYYPAPLPRFTLNGGESVTQNVIMWPK